MELNLSCSCEAVPEEEPLKVGDKVHHIRRSSDKVRINGKCPSWIRYISDSHVVVTYHQDIHGYPQISEKVYKRYEFEETMERCPGA